VQEEATIVGTSTSKCFSLFSVQGLLDHSPPLSLTSPTPSPQNGRSTLGTHFRRYAHVLLVALIVATLFFPASALAVQAFIDADTYIDGSAPNKKGVNHGGDASCLISGSVPTGQTTFLRFDFSTLASGTTGASVQKATLTFFVKTVTAAGNFNVNTVNT